MGADLRVATYGAFDDGVLADDAVDEPAAWADLDALADIDRLLVDPAGLASLDALGPIAKAVMEAVIDP